MGEDQRVARSRVEDRAKAKDRAAEKEKKTKRLEEEVKKLREEKKKLRTRWPEAGLKSPIRRAKRQAEEGCERAKKDRASERGKEK